jgi:hypothetical protein
MQFFQVIIANGNRWHLDFQTECAPLDIWSCRPIQVREPIPLSIFKEGESVDFDCAPYAIPVVSRRFAETLQQIAPYDIQRLPAVLRGVEGEWEIVNVVSRIDCIDFRQSKISYYPPDHPESPGKPRGVMRLVLDSSRIGQHHVLRPKDWEVAFIVSESVKSALDAIGATGFEYLPVTV